MCEQKSCKGGSIDVNNFPAPCNGCGTGIFKYLYSYKKPICNVNFINWYECVLCGCKMSYYTENLPKEGKLMEEQ